MAFEALKAGIYMLMGEIEKDPEDVHVLQEELREKIAELRSLSLPVPEDILRFEKELEAPNAEEIYDEIKDGET